MEFKHRHKRQLWNPNASTVSDSLAHGSGDTHSFSYPNYFGYTDNCSYTYSLSFSIALRYGHNVRERGPDHHQRRWSGCSLSE
jgi:hypothetical protein